MESPRQITYTAYAKVNLILSVGAPFLPEAENAGMHPIASWMACIDLADTLHITRRLPETPSRYTVAWADDAPVKSEIDWPLEDDLAVRAHRLLEETAGRPLPVEMNLTKRIPVGGGLGGGSSDAAAMLLAGSELFGLHMADDQLRALGARLGSDVAYFLDPGHTPARPAIVTGLGDQVQRIERVRGRLAMVMPGLICPTGPVYRAFDELLLERTKREQVERAVQGKSGRERQTGPRATLVQSRYEKALAAGKIDGDLLFNDLAIPAFRTQPPLGRLVTALSNTTREPAHVSGSGSSVFLVAPGGREERLMERVGRLIGLLRDGEDEALRGIGMGAMLVSLV